MISFFSVHKTLYRNFASMMKISLCTILGMAFLMFPQECQSANSETELIFIHLNPRENLCLQSVQCTALDLCSFNVFVSLSNQHASAQFLMWTVWGVCYTASVTAVTPQWNTVL